MAAAHSLLSASAADRWTACPGSIPLSQGLPDTAGAAALEGSGLHALTEQCLVTGKDAVDFDSITFMSNGKEHTIDLLTDEQQDVVQQIVDHVRSFSGSKFYEMQVTYGRAIGQDSKLAWGTSDISILDGTHLHVMDAKFGRRFVSQHENKQMLLYAIGVVDALEALGDEVETISLHILQPRVTAKLGNDPWTITRLELDHYIAEFQTHAEDVAQAIESFDPNSQDWWNEWVTPGELQCQYCRAAASCKPLIAMAAAVDAEVHATEVATGDFDVVPYLETLAPAQIALAMERLPILDIYAKAVKAEAFRRVGEGKTVPGFKLIKGRQGHRKWEDEAKAIEAAIELGATKAAIYGEPKVKSPAQMEKVFAILLESKQDAKDEVDALVVRNPPKPSLVKEEQPGDLWIGSADITEFGLE